MTNDSCDDAHDPAGVVIHDHAHPPGKWPSLEKGKGRPHGPESRPDGYDRQIDLPKVVGVLGGDDAFRVGASLIRRWRGNRLLLEHWPDGSDAKVQSRPGEDLGDLCFAEHRAEGLQLLNDVPYEVGKPVDRLAKLDQGFGTVFVDSPQPRAYRHVQ